MSGRRNDSVGGIDAVYGTANESGDERGGRRKARKRVWESESGG